MTRNEKDFVVKPNDNDSQDTLLLSLLKNDDKDAFDLIFRKYYQPLCAYAYRVVSMHDAEEVVQDLLLWMWQNRAKLNIKMSLRAYLYQSVRLNCIKRLQSKKAQRRRETIYWELTYTDVEEGDYNIEELLSLVHTAISKLPETYKEAFIKHRFRGSSYQEIAEDLGISSKTVDYRISRALKLLRSELKKYFQ